MVEKAWFEMRELRKRKLNDAVWIPLRSTGHFAKTGDFGHLGYIDEYYGVGSIVVPLKYRSTAAKLGWSDIGPSQHDAPYVDEGEYVAADRYRFWQEEGEGTRLVFDIYTHGAHSQDWILHPDIILGFGLIREGDYWLAPADGYVEVVRIRRDAAGHMMAIEIRAEHLKDYLAARQAGLYVTSYRSRQMVLPTQEFVWTPEEWEHADGVRWQGHVTAIHEGGMRYGERAAVFHVGHKNFDGELDVPVLPHPLEGEFDSKNWEVEHAGRKVFSVEGEFWKEEWVEPGLLSTRIREDKQPSTTSFIVDASGQRFNGDQLTKGGRWLWFRPDVIPALGHRRGGSLEWYTRFTGGVTCIPSSRIHYGTNHQGLVNVYAKDIGYLPEWQQRIWAGFNVSPEGGVSEELQMAQVKGEPAQTQAPELFLPRALERINQVSMKRFATMLMREHEQLGSIVERTHRFRALDSQGLFALAKDLARVTADQFDARAIRKLLRPDVDEKLGSLKCVEKLLSKDIGTDRARSVLGPLFGVWELRLGDAHLPKGDQEAAFQLVGVNRSLPLVHQGAQLIAFCVATLYDIAYILEHKTEVPPS